MDVPCFIDIYSDELQFEKRQPCRFFYTLKQLSDELGCIKKHEFD